MKHLSFFVFAKPIRFTAIVKWFYDGLPDLFPAYCIIKPRRCAASSAVYAFTAELIKNDPVAKPICIGHNKRSTFFLAFFWTSIQICAQDPSLNQSIHFSDTSRSVDNFSEGRITAVDRAGNTINKLTYYANYHPLNATKCPQTGTISGSSGLFCSCNLQKTKQDILLYSNHDPLNGVNTYDLVLISRHSLGLEPLTGFNLLAADANMSGTVSTIDGVELRKLILGTYTTLPKANSWRFIDKNLQNSILGSDTPFYFIGYKSGENNSECDSCLNIAAIPAPNQFTPGEFATFMLPAGSQDAQAEFIGFKVGDVDGGAIPNEFLSLEDRSAMTLAIGQTTVQGQKGDIVEVVVASKEAQSLSGLQLALGFNPDAVAIQEVRWALPTDEYNPETSGWNIASPGELRLLWYDAFSGFEAEKDLPLCTIRIKLLRDMAESAPVFVRSSGAMPSLCFSPAGAQKTLVLGIADRAALKPAPVHFSNRPAALKIYPNPASRMFRIELWSGQETAGELAIIDAAGQTVSIQSVRLVPGLNTLTSRQLPNLVAGQYEVRLSTGNALYSARLVKQ